VLKELLPRHVPVGGTVLEIASGSGYHACFFARAMPAYVWQPSDLDPWAVQVDTAAHGAALSNLRAPFRLDVRDRPWPTAQAVLCINMIHISPWSATLALFAGASEILLPGAPLITYGPYTIAGDFQAESNRAFDASLRGRNPEWGLRDMADIIAVATENGFAHVRTQAMPANNHMIAFLKSTL
jgi:hypothetical protein